MATTQILPFCTEAAGAGGNRLSPSAYAALTTLLATGFQSGTANSQQANTALAQATFMAAGLANFCVAQGVNVPDDGNLTNLVTELEAALSAFVAASVPGAAPTRSALKGAWASNTTATYTATQLTALNSSLGSVSLASYNQTLNTATAGAGGLDTGSLSASKFYYVWAIYNPTTSTTSILMSLSSTAPTLPSGYTYKSRIGSLYIDGSSNIMGFSQIGNEVTYKLGSNLPNLPTIASGSAGSYGSSSTTYATASLSTSVPPTAAYVTVQLGGTGGGNNVVGVAPNTSYSGGYNNTTCPLANIDTYYNTTTLVRLLAESGNIYYMSQSSGGFAQCYGYTENF